MHFSNSLFKIAVGVIGVMALLAPINTYSQNFATIPSTSPQYDIDITVCKKVFDWDQFITDLNNGTQNSAPYTPLTCGPDNQIRLTNVVANNFTQYRQGQVSTPQAQSFFGDQPIIGIFQNGTFAAQNLGVGSPAPVNRNNSNAISNVFSPEQLNQIYSTGGARTATPRIGNFTFVDANNDGVNDADTYTNLQKYVSIASGNAVNFGICSTQRNGTFEFDSTKCRKEPAQLSECVTDNRFNNNLCDSVYTGGICEVVNGQIQVRRLRAGLQYNIPSSIDPSNPSVACRPQFQGENIPTVQDTSLQVYQFLYQINYPTQAQCNRFPPSGVDFNSCREFYQGVLGRDLANNTDFNSGQGIIAVATYYGTFDDRYSRWVGWNNADVDIDSRNRSQNPFINSWRGYSIYEY